MMNFWTYAVPKWQLRIATRPDNESAKMTNFLPRDHQIMSNAGIRATSSAVCCVLSIQILDGTIYIFDVNNVLILRRDFQLVKT